MLASYGLPMQKLLNDSPSLDHLGWIADDLNSSAIAWEKLGFRLSRVSPQMGFTGPNGDLELWGTANRCALFRAGYLELIGVVDEERFNPWKTYLERGARPHIAAFRVAKANSAYPLLSSRIQGFDPPVQRSRMAPIGLHKNAGEIEMRFRNIFSQDDFWPEGRIIIIEHQTPEALWQRELLDHPNGATALVEAIFTSPDAHQTSERVSLMLNQPQNSKTFTTPGDGKVTILEPSEFAARFPGAQAPNRPSISAAVVTVKDLAVVDRVASANHVRLSKIPEGGLAAIGKAAVGGVIAFVEA